MCDSIIELDQDFQYPYLCKAVYYLMSNDISEATELCDKAIQLMPRYGDAYALRARILFVKENKTQQDYFQILDDCNKAIKFNPFSQLAYRVRADIHLIAGKANAEEFALAIADYTRAIEINPEEISHYYNRALAKIGNGDISGAKSDLERVIILSNDEKLKNIASQKLQEIDK